MDAGGDTGRSSERQAVPPAVIVVMGVAGVGKTTTAEGVAAALGWPFRDADSFHPRANIEKMKRGVPLDDTDRAPWLAAIAAWIDETRASGGHAVVTCSALKRAYRRVIVGDRPDVRLVYLKCDRATIATRIGRRRGHFMPAALLDSQFAALEPPGPDELPITVSVRLPPKAVVARVLEALHRPAPEARG